MKKSLVLFLASLMVCALIPDNKADAQIWKKIKKNVKDRVEDVVVDKTADKAAQVAAENMDKLLNANINPFPKGTEKANTENLPEQYSFSWKYQLKIKSTIDKEQHNLIFDYYLEPQAPYFGYTMQQAISMFSVMDSEKKIMVSYIEQEGQSVGMAYEMPESTDENTETEDAYNDLTVTELPDKQFLGYNAKGLQLENDEYNMTMYWTEDTPVSLMDAFSSEKSGVPQKLKSYIKENSTGLMMYMKFDSKTGTKGNFEMECISLEETSMVKQNSDYTFM